MSTTAVEKYVAAIFGCDPTDVCGLYLWQRERDRLCIAHFTYGNQQQKLLTPFYVDGTRYRERKRASKH